MATGTGLTARAVRATALACATALGAVGLVGCSNNQDTGAVVGAVAGGLLGNTVGKGSGRVAATAVGAVLGGIVGSEIGRSMDERDRYLAERAQIDALERGRSGDRTNWRNPDNGHYGEIVPERPYRRGSADCRDYAHTVVIDGRREIMRGTACRDRDGSWRNVA